MNKVIAYQDNNGVSIVIPTGEVSLEVIVKNDIPKNVKYKIIDSSEVPLDRSFRDAWIFNNGIDIDLEKAKLIHKNNIRKIRETILKELDIQYQITVENNLNPTEIIKKKNQLRDATNNILIDNAKSIKDLKNTWDCSLLGKSPYN